MKRNGILAAGIWVVDYIKMINKWPEQNMATYILEEKKSVGGGPFNVLVGLDQLQCDFPLHAGGLIGNDLQGKYILKEVSKYNINAEYLRPVDGYSTSYSDVMTVINTGERTFFHEKGANSAFDVSHTKNIKTSAKIFHLAYLLALDKLDSKDREYGVVAARLLHNKQKEGYLTSVDLVSIDSTKYNKTVRPCLKYTDYLIINDYEAEKTSGIIIRKNGSVIKDKLLQASEKLLEYGVNKMIIIHFAEGGFALAKSGISTFVPSFVIDKKDFKSTVGAGDAFCAGCLYSIHENLGLTEMLKIAHACAKFNIASKTTVGKPVSISDIRTFIKTREFRKTILND